jgi:hypothetical protein
VTAKVTARKSALLFVHFKGKKIFACISFALKRGGQQGALCGAGRPNLQGRFIQYSFHLRIDGSKTA